MSIVCIGDLHLRTDNWYKECLSSWLDWFEKIDFVPGSTLIQLGDPTHKDLLSGDTMYLLMRWVDTCRFKFKHTYVITGNHELKMYKGRVQKSTEFLKRESKFTVVEKETEATIEDKRVLMLPFQRIPGKTIEEYYDNYLDPNVYSTEYDLIVGHVGALEKGLKFGGVNFKRFKYKRLCLGHIHTRLQKSEYRDSYIGSVMPMSVAEAIDPQDPRCIRVYGGDSVTDICHPQVVRYSSVKFPNPIIRPDDMMTTVYRVDDCRSLTRAKFHYPGEHIYAVEKKREEVEIKSGEKVKRFENKWEAFTDMVRETGQVLNRRVHGYLKEVLGGTGPTN